jgi:HEAT repeat protein
MSAPQLLLLGLVCMSPPAAAGAQPQSDLPRLRELLQDTQHPRQQSQAALLLVQTPGQEAEEIVKQALRQLDAADPFCALASALRLSRDTRFSRELLIAVNGAQPQIRLAAAETLVELADGPLMSRLQTLIEDSKIELEVRQTLTRALARSTKKSAVVLLLNQLANADGRMRQAAADALTALSGMNYGLDPERWAAWWSRRRDLSEESWLEERLAYQSSRSQRVEGELERARAVIVRLHEQIYARLSPGDRLNHIQAMSEADEGAVRALAVTWSVELLAAADEAGQRVVADLLLRLSHDGDREVKRSAILALGRVHSPRVFDRLCLVMHYASPTLRAAAARALGQEAWGSGPEAEARQRQVIPILQKALDDPALEVVVEAAESLGSLGVPEAGSVLTVLLRHPSESVRQTAAMALERVADTSMLDGLLGALDDPALSVRFSLLGALERAAGDGHELSESQLARLVARVEGLFVRDVDPGVRSRAATVLGDCGSPAVLPVLWRRVQATEEGRVQEKAWAAMVEVLARSGNLELIREWDHTLAEAGQKVRRLQLWSEVYARWHKQATEQANMKPVLENLIQAQLDQGKWSAALPLLRELLTRKDSDAARERYLGWWLSVGEQALKEGNRTEARRALEEARPYLNRASSIARDFEKLEKLSRP